MTSNHLSSSPASSTNDHGRISGSPATMSAPGYAELRVWVYLDPASGIEVYREDVGIGQAVVLPRSLVERHFRIADEMHAVEVEIREYL